MGARRAAYQPKQKLNAPSLINAGWSHNDLVRGPDDPREGKGDEDREDNRLKRRLEVLARVDLVGTSSLGEEQLHNVVAQHLVRQATVRPGYSSHVVHAASGGESVCRGRVRTC